MASLTTKDSTWPSQVWAYWFETLQPKDWFVKDNAIDVQIRQQFEPLYEDVIVRSDTLSATTALDTLALILVLDQFPRNMFRNTPRAFASDPVALRLSEEAIAQRLDQSLSARECQFLYMPFQHSEDKEVQVRSVALYEALGLDAALDFARRHKQVIDRFGRFPHRNAILGRASTEAERAYLAEPGSGF